MIQKLSSDNFLDQSTYKDYCELYDAYEREQHRETTEEYKASFKKSMDAAFIDATLYGTGMFKTEHIQATKFMKSDAGKNMLSLIDPQFVVLLGEILTFGAKKYAPNNWQLCEDASRYKDALLRHLYAYLGGEQLDPESRMSHLGHAAFGLMCLNYFDNLKKDQQ